MDEFLIQIAVAFIFGLGARFASLPPMVGFLVAGFALNLFGFSPTPELDDFADLGVTLLLFTIGLKLRIRDLTRSFVWAGASLHMFLTIAIFSAILFFLPFGIIGELDLTTAILIAFALSFSSTVFAVKIFEEQGRSNALHAQAAIGILIIQDLIAVIFIVATADAPPSLWALALLALLPARHALAWLARYAGHGELLLLLGIVMAIGGYALFDAVGLKGDLGALVFGMLIADQPKAKEMASSLMSFKDLFLVGFFVSIGLKGLPSLADVGVALFIVVLLAAKVALYFYILQRFRLRARTATMTALGLANYSEFGLIVAALGVSVGWLSDQWLLIIAVAVAFTFIIASPLNAVAAALYDRFRSRLRRFESDQRLPEDQPVRSGDAEIVIFGMGRLGSGAYDALSKDYGARLLGVDIDPRTVRKQIDSGRKVIRGDPTDASFWERTVLDRSVRVCLLALPNQRATLVAASEIERHQNRAEIFVAATARYDDQVRELLDHGVDAAFDLYAEAGQGYADFVRDAVPKGSSA